MVRSSSHRVFEIDLVAGKAGQPQMLGVFAQNQSAQSLEDGPLQVLLLPK